MNIVDGYYFEMASKSWLGESFGQNEHFRSKWPVFGITTYMFEKYFNISTLLLVLIWQTIRFMLQLLQIDVFIFINIFW